MLIINVFFYKLDIVYKSRNNYKQKFVKQIIRMINESTILNIVDNISNADIIFTFGDYIHEPCLENKKLIVYSYQDNCFLNDKVLNNKNVLVILDHCKVTDIDNNYNVINGNRLKYILSKYYDKDIKYTPLNLIDNSYNKKVKCLLNISRLYKKIFKHDIKPLSEREYDLVFLGWTNYDTNITKHRLDTKKIIETVCKKNNIKYYLNDNLLKHNHYLNLLSMTKIFVSPYGWGEFSTKDYECICCGAHILKPKIYFEYYPNFCKNMDDFEVDYSNFENKVLNILNNIEQAQEKVDDNRKMFLEYNEKEHFLELEKNIIQVYKI